MRAQEKVRVRVRARVRVRVRVEITGPAAAAVVGVVVVVKEEGRRRRGRRRSCRQHGYGLAWLAKLGGGLARAPTVFLPVVEMESRYLGTSYLYLGYCLYLLSHVQSTGTESWLVPSLVAAGMLVGAVGTGSTKQVQSVGTWVLDTCLNASVRVRSTFSAAVGCEEDTLPPIVQALFHDLDRRSRKGSR